MITIVDSPHFGKTELRCKVKKNRSSRKIIDYAKTSLSHECRKSEVFRKCCISAYFWNTRT